MSSCIVPFIRLASERAATLAAEREAMKNEAAAAAASRAAAEHELREKIAAVETTVNDTLSVSVDELKAMVTATEEKAATAVADVEKRYVCAAMKTVFFFMFFCMCL